MAHTATAKTFAEMIAEVRNGSQEAAWELVDQYGGHIQRFVRRSMHQQLRSKFDSLDFVQVVWASLFREPEKLRAMKSPEDLIAMLAGMAKHKVLDEVRRRLQSGKYNVAKERPFETSGEVPAAAMHSPTPTPSAVAMAHERWNQLLASETDTVQTIVSLRLQGTSFVEIADRLRIHERTARKAIEGLLARASDRNH